MKSSTGIADERLVARRAARAELERDARHRRLVGRLDDVHEVVAAEHRPLGLDLGAELLDLLVDLADALRVVLERLDALGGQGAQHHEGGHGAPFASRASAYCKLRAVLRRVYDATWGRVFACGYDRFFSGASEEAGLRELRRELLGQAARDAAWRSAPGTGLNLDALAGRGRPSWCCPSPTAPWPPQLREKVAEAGRTAEVVEAPGEDLPFPDDSFDTVALTLRALHRARPGGRAARDRPRAQARRPVPVPRARALRRAGPGPLAGPPARRPGTCSATAATATATRSPRSRRSPLDARARRARRDPQRRAAGEADGERLGRALRSLEGEGAHSSRSRPLAVLVGLAAPASAQAAALAVESLEACYRSGELGRPRRLRLHAQRAASTSTSRQHADRHRHRRTRAASFAGALRVGAAERRARPDLHGHRAGQPGRHRVDPAAGERIRGSGSAPGHFTARTRFRDLARAASPPAARSTRTSCAAAAQRNGSDRPSARALAARSARAGGSSGAAHAWAPTRVQFDTRRRYSQPHRRAQALRGRCCPRARRGGVAAGVRLDPAALDLDVEAARAHSAR